MPHWILAFACCAIGALGLASTAQAGSTHKFTGTSFGPDGVGGTEKFGRVQSVTVGDAGTVYVFDGAAGKIFKFDSAGAPENFSATGTNAISGVGVANGGAEYELAVAPAGAPGGTEGDVYVALDSVVKIYSPAGTLLGQLEGDETVGHEACGVATRPGGNVLVGFHGSTVLEYEPTGNPVTDGDQVNAGLFEVGLCNVAASNNGGVYLANSHGKGLFKAGELEGGTIGSPNRIDASATTMAVDPKSAELPFGSAELFADRENEIVEYDSEGRPQGSFGAGQVSESHGIGVTAGAAKIYVGTKTAVKVFGPSLVLPDSFVGGANEITRQSATLHGEIGPAGGPPATCVFQYVTAAEFTSGGFTGADEKPCSPAGPFTGTERMSVAAAVTGLARGTTYRFRLLSSNENGSNPSEAGEFTTAAVNVNTLPASSITGAEATLNGTVNPEGLPLTECFFEYGLQTFPHGTPGIAPCESPDAAGVGSGGAPVNVHANVKGLSGGANYYFDLVARNSAGSGKSSESFFKTAGPTIESESANEVTLESAQLEAAINPNGSETTYYFEYVSEAEFNANGYANAIHVPSEPASIGTGTNGLTVAEKIEHLAQRGTYHFRAVATNATGTSIGPDSVFTAYSAAATGLPDSRAYEQASPVAKNGTNIQFSGSMIQAAANGNGITFFSSSGIPGGVGSQDFPLFLARRDASGWSTQGILPPQETGPRGSVRGWDEQLNEIFTSNFNPDTFATQGATMYGLETSTKNVTPVGTHLKTLRPFIAGTSADGSVVAWEEAPFGPPAGQSVVVLDRSTGELRTASVFNDGAKPRFGAAAGPYEWYLGSVSTGVGGGAKGSYFTQHEHVLSADGSKLFFTDNSSRQIYVRINPARAQSAMSGGECVEADKACTVEVSAPTTSTPDPNGRRAAIMVGATPDGRYVFFMSGGALTPDATTGPNDEGRDLYRYDTETGSLIDLTPDENDENGARVLGSIGFGDDGSHAYFVAKGVLDEGATVANFGETNLYEWNAGSITFIRRLTTNESTDALNWLPAANGQEAQPIGRVSADGSVLLFGSVNNLTGFQSHEHLELYRFDADGDQLACISCLPTKGVPTGTPSLSNSQGYAYTSPNTKQSILTRGLAANGNRIFFDSPDRLVNTDVNSVSDVYEWEAPGTGSCSSEDFAGGCLYLISTGTSPQPSYFGDNSVSGDDVFFFTTQPLVGQDKDEVVDVYDARVGGGLAGQNPPPPAVPCTGTACRGVATAASPTQQRGSSTFSGPGNEKPAKKKPKKHPKKHHKEKHKAKHRKHRKHRKHKSSQKAAHRLGGRND